MPPLDLPIDSPWPLTEREAAEFLHLSVRTLQAWRLQSKGPPYVLAGGTIRYLYCDVIAWMKSRRIVPDGDDKSRSTEADFSELSKGGTPAAEPDRDPPGTKKSTVGAQKKSEVEDECQHWLEAEMRKSLGGTDKSKAQWQAEAKALRPTLSERAFLRIWDNALANTGARWSKPGRKPKSPHR